MLAEGFHSESSRGDKTPVELFLNGLRQWSKPLTILIEQLMADSAI